LYATPLPYILGREGAGFVEAVGDEVTSFAKGDRVAYMEDSLDGVRQVFI